MLQRLVLPMVAQPPWNRLHQKRKLMKALHLTLAKELLIVEVPENYQRFEIANNVANTESVMIKFFTSEYVYQPLMIEIKGVLKLCCKAIDLTEDIAKGLVETIGNQSPMYQGEWFVNYSDDESMYDIALESFKSAVEAKQIELGIKIDLSKSLIFEIL